MRFFSASEGALGRPGAPGLPGGAAPGAEPLRPRRFSTEPFYTVPGIVPALTKSETLTEAKL